MSDIVLAEKDAATVLAAALEVYRQATISSANPNGITLAPVDPRRLHLQAFLLLLAQQRQLIDYSGKQSLLRYVDRNMPIASAVLIKELAALWGEVPIPAKPSQCTVRFHFGATAAWTIPAGVRVSDGTNLWQVLSSVGATDDHVDTTVVCTILGASTNGLAPGQINVLVDPTLIPQCTSVENLTETVSGRDTESTEDFRTRLRSVPESRSTCGPRVAYQQAAFDASANVADAVALGPNDAGEMFFATAPNPGEVHVLITEGTRDAAGKLTSVVPDPSGGLISAVTAALSAEDVRPLTDSLTVKAPIFVEYDIDVTYYISRDREDDAVTIQAAVEAARDAYILWQSKIGRDVNPSVLIARLVNAGAKRVAVTSPVFNGLFRNECGRLVYNTLTYGGIEDD